MCSTTTSITTFIASIPQKLGRVEKAESNCCQSSKILSALFIYYCLPLLLFLPFAFTLCHAFGGILEGENC